MLPNIRQELDFSVISEEQKRTYLAALRKAHPKVSHFQAGKMYSIVSQRLESIYLSMKDDLFLVLEEGRDCTWYLGSQRDWLVNESIDNDCYLISGTLLHTTKFSHQTALPSRMTFYVVNVDFDKPLNLPSAKYLASLLPTLAEQFDASHFKKGLNAIELDHDVILFLHLSLDLVPRKSRALKKPERNGQHRFALVTALLGQGSYSQVYDNPITLRISEDQLFEKTHHPRVTRYTLLKQPGVPDSKGATRPRVQKEDTVMQQLPQFKSKPTFFKQHTNFPGREVAIRFEKRMPGENLESILDRGIQDWTLVQRLRVVIAILRALHEQVHGNDVIHTDVKPANLLVANWSAIFPTVNMIDFNLSRLKSHPTEATNVIYGTPLYYAPERFCWGSSHSTEASDVFAAGITVAQLFYHDPVQTAQTEDEVEAYAKNYRFIELFEDLPFEDSGADRASFRDEIEAILKRMVSAKPEERPGLLAAADQFEHVLIRLIAEPVPCLQGRRPGFSVQV